MTSVPSGCPHLPRVPASTPWPDLLLLCTFVQGAQLPPKGSTACPAAGKNTTTTLCAQGAPLTGRSVLLLHSHASLSTEHSTPSLSSQPIRPYSASLSQTAGNFFYFPGKRRRHVHMLPLRGEEEPPFLLSPQGSLWMLLGHSAIHPLVPPQGHGSSSVPSPALSRRSLCTGSPPAHSTKTLSLLPSQPNLLRAPSLPAASWLLHSWISSPRSSRTLPSRLFLHHPVEMVEVIKDFSALLLLDLPAAALGTGVTLPP